VLSAPTPLPFLGHDDDDLFVHSEAPTSQQTLHWCVCVCGARPDPCQSTRAWTMCHCLHDLSTTAGSLVIVCVVKLAPPGALIGAEQ
jgi:hypothetical protein